MYEFSIDWLSFTVKNLEIEEILKTLDTSELMPLKKGKLGYKRGYLYHTAYILYDGMENMGIHVDIPSSSLFIAHHFLLNPSLQNKVDFTRIDLACDAKNVSFYDNAAIACALQNYKTRRKKRSEIKSHDTNNNKLTGRTIYFGSRTSDTFLRIYDKALEEGAKEDWTRIELEIKGDNAKILASKIANQNSIGHTFCGILKNYINFIDRSASKNISRCPNLEFWDDLLLDQEKLVIAPKKEEKTLDQSYIWLLKQVSKTLAKIQYFDEISDNKLTEGLERIGYQKLSPEDKAKIQKYYERKKEEWTV